MSHQLPYPHEKQREFMLSQARFKALVWGRRSGKSLGIALYTMLKALEKPGNYYIIAPTYTQAKSIYWKDILKVLIPDAIVKKTDEGELYVEFQQVHYQLQTEEILGYNIDSDHSKEQNPSTIYLKGANNPDSLRGVKLCGAVLDEFAFFQYANDTWRKIIRPALADLQGWAIFSSTPDGVHNSFFDIVETAKQVMGDSSDPMTNKKWFYSHATMLDNTSIGHRVEEWNDTKAEYIREGKIDEWVQEWEAKFTTPSSLVYNEFDDEKHVISPNLIPRNNVTYAIGMDFGLKDPFAAVFVVIDQNDNWYIYDEIYLPDLPVDKIASVLHTKMGEEYFTRIIGDSAGATEIASLKSKALGEQRVWVTPAKKGKDSIRGGIRQVKTKLYVREATGKPKLFVGRNCKATIKEFQSYKRLRDAWGEVSETPEDKNNHLMDALRYLVLDQMSGAKPIPKAQKVYDPNTGRLVS
jgi:phage terminase large subunit